MKAVAKTTAMVLADVSSAAPQGCHHTDDAIYLQRVNFSYLEPAALKRLGQFYNVPEAQYGCSLDELAYAVASAFMREVQPSACFCMLTSTASYCLPKTHYSATLHQHGAESCQYLRLNYRGICVVVGCQKSAASGHLSWKLAHAEGCG